LRAILPIAGVPDELIRTINDRLREIEQQIQPASDPGSATLPNVGTPGRFTAGVTDAKGRVVERHRLQVSDLPGGGYPALPVPLHDVFYAARSSSIATVTVTPTAAGRYRFAYIIGVTTGGAGTITLTINWTSNGTGRTLTVGPLTLTAATNLTQTYLLNVDASTSITYATTYVAPGAYEFAAAITEL
jgi:hypothetical protein